MTDSLTPSETYQILQQLGHQPKKKLGQNFLIDKNIVQKSLDFSEVQAGDVVVEVGPGLGTLTRALLAAEAEVYAVEKDPALFGYLSEDIKSDKLHLMLGDALDEPIALLPEKYQSSYKIIANLPYAISSPWLDKVLSGPLPESLTLLVQKEAADRFMAKDNTKSFGPISIFLQSAYELSHSHRISASCFYPKPKVDSALVSFKRKEAPLVYDLKTRKFIRTLFLQRRKQLGSIMKGIPDSPEVEKFQKILKESSIELTLRAEQVPLEIWHRLN